jgi:2-dehydro-3-deoxyphosphogluconate aldolase/(4S)-4-hydroxy-2-oxoglutarate aldolase
MPVGGVSLENASEFIKNGALALGIGSELVNRKWVQEGNFDKITQIAEAFLEKVKSARQ